jgi:hypothetical protein
VTNHKKDENNNLLCISPQVRFLTSLDSVADLDPDVFEPPGSGFTSERYGSGPFYHQAKIVRKTLIPTVLSFVTSLLIFYL